VGFLISCCRRGAWITTTSWTSRASSSGNERITVCRRTKMINYTTEDMTLLACFSDTRCSTRCDTYRNDLHRC